MNDFLHERLADTSDACPNLTVSGDEAIVILESLICLMREKNLLSRSDIETLCYKVERRAMGTSRNPMPCNAGSATQAVGYLRRLSAYLGQRYGGKHQRRLTN